jgi:hypothetical protein
MRPAILAACAIGCGLPDPGSMVRVVDGAPAGAGVDRAVEPSIRFSGAVAPEGLVDGRRFLLVRQGELRAALAAAESEEGAAPSVPRVAGSVELREGSTRLVFRPNALLAPGVQWALILSSRALAPDGRHVLDADGRLKPTVLGFATAALPPPGVLFTELRADAETPEAGGEYAEILNLGPGPLDLAGWRLEKRSASGSWSGCTVGEWAGAPTAVGGVALLVGEGWDGRYGLPPGTALFPCGAGALAGGIANDRTPVLRLVDREGALAASLDATGTPLCAGALEGEYGVLLPGAVASRWSCTEGSPGQPVAGP